MVTGIWGVLNVTPDSFSDGGLFLDSKAALAQAFKLVEAGANVIDVGGESTRPGAERVSLETELDRVIPIIKELATAGVNVSVDTMRAEVARSAVEVGAKIINDVSGGKADSEMFSVVAASDADYVLMHWRGHSDVMQQLVNYEDVTAEVIAEWQTQAALAEAAGIKSERIIFDPGIGFSKTAEQNWQLLQNIGQFKNLPYRCLLGVSRKRFLADVISGSTNADSAVTDRDLPTAVLSFYAAQNDLFAVRVHDVSSSAAAIRVASALGIGGF
ncbi:MAG: hypothetical protein RL038_958 [Actinomycetota bacterium]